MAKPKRDVRGTMGWLLAKARAGLVNWRVKGVFEEGGRPLYAVVVEGGSMEVGLGRGVEEYVFFLRGRGEVEAVRASDAASADWGVIEALYAEARRAVEGGEGVRRAKGKRVGEVDGERLPYWA